VAGVAVEVNALGGPALEGFRAIRVEHGKDADLDFPENPVQGCVLGKGRERGEQVEDGQGRRGFVAVHLRPHQHAPLALPKRHPVNRAPGCGAAADFDRQTAFVFGGEVGQMGGQPRRRQAGRGRPNHIAVIVRGKPLDQGEGCLG
jgi:hypothetical protein